MPEATGNVTIPRLLTTPMRILPLWPVSMALSQLARNLLRAHPEILQRIDKYQNHHFELDITDLPFILRLDPARAQLRAFRRGAAPASDARIAGSFAAFLAMLHGAEDGDTLYFSGALQIEGDTSAVLALRNALDDAELDLGVEIANLLPFLAAPLRQSLAPLERLTGLHLKRADTTPEVY
jgi:predicted lipid carrier protein YhbT